MVVKVIKIKSCFDCPFCGKCKAWKSLTSKQRVLISIGVGTPDDFILAKCHLKDED